MSVLIFANNAKTTLSSALTSSATTVNVASGTGSLFPNPSGTQYFILTLVDAATGLLNEIMWCTARSGDALTVIRGQEGTTAKAWLLGDYVNCFPTAGTQATFVQPDQVQKGTYGFASAAGTVNALTATVASDLGSMPDGMSMVIESTGANTGAVTLNLTMGSTITGVYAIVKGNNSALVAGDIPIAGYPIQLNWSSTLNSWVMQNPATGIFVAAVPTGAIVQFPATTAPSGYLIANGQLVSRTTYASLWTFAQASGNLVSDTVWQGGQYGSFSTGDGSTTFRIPQYGGYFLRALDNGNAIDPSRVLGSVQSNQNLSHTHTWSGSTNTGNASANIVDPSHTHSSDAVTIQTVSFNGTPGGYNVPNVLNWPGATINPAFTGVYDSGHNHSVSLSGTTSGNGGSESRPINISVLTCIKY